MLQAYKLRKTFGRQVALNDVSFHVEKGETLVVMGPSGCGKSTLLRCVNRLVQPDEGEIWFHDRAVMDFEGEELRNYRRQIGFVFQQCNLVGHLTALENVALGPLTAGVPRDRARSEALATLDRVGLAKFAHKLPAGLSGGEQQRVAIARALAMKPELIIWDEPTAALDPIMVEEVLSIMAELAGEQETAMVVVTHEIPFALAVADRVLLMEDGQVVAEGEPHATLFQSEAPVSKRFRRLFELRYAGAFGTAKRPRGRKEIRRARNDHSRPIGVTRKVLRS